MADIITKKERELIDAALPNKRTFPRGAYTTPSGWKGGGSRLVLPGYTEDGIKISELPPEKPLPDISGVAREEQIKRLAAAGLTASQIAARVGLKAPGVRRVAVRLGLKLTPAKPGRPF